MSQTTSSRGERWFHHFLIFACAALAVLVLLLVWQNRKLKEELSAVAAMQKPPEGLEQGDRFEPLVLLDDVGESSTLRFVEGGPRSLLLVFSTDCPACRETLPIWRSLLETPPEGIRVVGIQLGGDMPEVPYLPFSVFTPEDGGASMAGAIPFIPATLLLEAGGTVEQVWYGVLDEPRQQALREALE